MKTFTKSILIAAILFLMAGNVARAQLYIKLDATFYSEVLDEVRNIDVFLPSDYFIDTVSYATIYYLHGGEGNQNEGNPSAVQYYNFHSLDTTISSPPAIFVCPDGSCGPYAGSMWANSELYGPFEDYFMQDVIGFVESNFRAIPEKNFRSLVGWSMGGCGAVDLCTNHPDYFRTCMPGLASMAMSDTTLNSWRSTCFEENGSYNLSYAGSGFNTQTLFTCAGEWSPNLDIEPYHIEIPFDTLGNWVDTVLTKWYQHDMSRRVKDLPDETELSWFLVCGINDILCNYATYLAFSDSLEAYDIGYDYNYFDGGHEFDFASWIAAIHWMDSIINHSYQIIPGISDYHQASAKINVYPNPVRDQTVIALDIPAKNPVEICIYNATGACLKKWQYQNQQPGQIEYLLDLKDLPQGIYSCRVQIGNEMITRKIIKID